MSPELFHDANDTSHVSKYVVKLEDYTFPTIQRDIEKVLLKKQKDSWENHCCLHIIFPKYVYENVYVIICISFSLKETRNSI